MDAAQSTPHARRSAARAAEMERRFVVPITVAALLVIPQMIVQGTADSGTTWATVGQVANWVIWLTFLAEVVAMLRVVPDRKAWARGHLLDIGIVVLTPPVPKNVFDAIRVLRLLRLIRLFRLAPLLRGVFTIHGVQYAAFIALLTLLAGGEAFHNLETDQTLGHGLYWAIGTMTTSGSGRVNAIESSTQIVGSVLMVVGLAFAAILTGAIAQRFISTEDTVTEGDIETHEAQAITHAKLDALATRLDQLEAMIQDPGRAR